LVGGKERGRENMKQQRQRKAEEFKTRQRAGLRGGLRLLGPKNEKKEKFLKE